MSATDVDALETPRHGEEYILYVDNGYLIEEHKFKVVHTSAQENRQAPGAPRATRIVVVGDDFSGNVLF